MEKIIRCDWPGLNTSDLYQKYHDDEWGIPSYDDHHLFEMLVLESFQSGLSWLTILNKRDSFRKAFDQFDVMLVSNYKEEKIEALMNDKAIVRSRGKIKAAILNANIFIDIQAEFNSFSNYLWSFTNHQTIYDHPIKTQSELSYMISSDLKKRGMKYLGPVTVQAYLEAVGLTNHHSKECYKYVINMSLKVHKDTNSIT